MHGKLQHVLRHLDVRDVVEILVLVAHLVLVAQQCADDALAAWQQHHQPLAPVQHHPRDPDQPFRAHGLADDREGLGADLVLGQQVVGFIEINFVDLVARHEAFDVDRVGALERHLVELLLLQEHIGIAGLVALDAVLLRDLLAALGVDHVVADAVAGLAIDDVEANPLAGAGGRKQRDRARHQ